MLRKPIRRLWIYRWAQTRSIGITLRIARRYGERFGFVYVGGYPKSGTSWISRLAGHCLDLPVPRENALPLAFRCVVHHHWNWEPALDRPSIYVLRDGRDVMVSEFVSMMNGVEAMRERAGRFGRLSPAERALLHRFGRDARLERRMERLFGRGFDPWDVEAHLPRFIEASMERPFSEVVAEPWPQHVRGWRERSRGAAIVRYEAMLQDGDKTLRDALEQAVGAQVEPSEIAAALERHSFRRVSGRERGDEARGDFARKGVAGDWKNWFTPAAAEVFDHYAGDLLLELRYESDRAWVSRSALE